MKHIKLFETFVNESKYSSSDLKKLKAFAKEVADDIADTYGDYRSFDPDYYDENSMLNWILDWGTDNKLSADQIIKQFDWMSMSDELELNFRY